MDTFDRDHYAKLRGEDRYGYLEPFVNEHLSGGGTLAQSCRLYGFDASHYWHWLRKNDVRYVRYEDSLRHGAEPMADQFREIIVSIGMVNDPVKVARLRTQADLLWKYISRISPRMYSERPQLGLQSAESPLEMLTDDQKVRMAQAFLASRGVLPHEAE